MGTRPATASLPAVITFSRSASVSEAFSPSMGRTMMPETPFVMSRSMLACVASMSTDSSCFSLVVTAGKTPVQVVMVISFFSIRHAVRREAWRWHSRRCRRRG